MKSFRWSILLPLVGSGLCLWLSSCIIRMPSPAHQADPSRAIHQQTSPVKSSTVPIYLLADSLHTSLALPYEWLIENGFCPPDQLHFSRGPTRYVVMSWGDRVAYEQRRWLRPHEVFHALCMPSPSVTEIIPISWKVEQVCYQQRIFRKDISAACGKKLAAFLNASNRKDDQGRPKIIGPSSWGEGYLLDCYHSYYFPRICNVWTGQALEACGIDINIRKSISANSLIKQVQEQGFEWVHHGEATSNYGRDYLQVRQP